MYVCVCSVVLACVLTVCHLFVISHSQKSRWTCSNGNMAAPKQSPNFSLSQSTHCWIHVHRMGMYKDTVYFHGTGQTVTLQQADGDLRTWEMAQHPPSSMIRQMQIKKKSCFCWISQKVLHSFKHFVVNCFFLSSSVSWLSMQQHLCGDFSSHSNSSVSLW